MTTAYESPRLDVQALVPPTARRILDAGCASGALGDALKARDAAVEVVGIERDPVLAERAEGRLDRVVRADLAEPLPADLGTFDTIVCADVLEHLAEPDAALRRLLAHAAPGARVVVSLPNVRSWETFWQLGVRGTWPRRGVGLFDRTHLRWFTLADAWALVTGAGLEVESVTRRLLRPDGTRWPRPVERGASRMPGLRTLLTLQHLIVARRR